MSQIVTVSKFKISDLALAKEIATKLNWKEQGAGSVSGIGNVTAEVTFQIPSGHRVGFVKDAVDGRYTLATDRDIMKNLTKTFVVEYNVAFVRKNVEATGTSVFQTETDKEIVLEFEG
jgi:hypothetical protein